MALESEARLEVYGRPYSLLKVSERLVDDSEFPFAVGDSLLLTVDPKGKQIIVRKAPAPA